MEDSIQNVFNNLGLECNKKFNNISVIVNMIKDKIVLNDELFDTYSFNRNKLNNSISKFNIKEFTESYKSLNILLDKVLSLLNNFDYIKKENDFIFVSNDLIDTNNNINNLVIKYNELVNINNNKKIGLFNKNKNKEYYDIINI